MMQLSTIAQGRWGWDTAGEQGSQLGVQQGNLNSNPRSTSVIPRTIETHSDTGQWRQTISNVNRDMR